MSPSATPTAPAAPPAPAASPSHAAPFASAAPAMRGAQIGGAATPQLLSPPASGIPWRILFVTLVASALSNIDQSMFGYAMPGVMRDLDVSLRGIGLVISASFAFAIFSAPAIASAVPRIGAPAVLAASVAVSALLVGLQSVAPSAAVFVPIRILSFGMSAAIIPVSGAYLATNSPDRGRAMLIAVQQCGYPLGWFLASLIAAPLMAAHGWRSTFVVAFAVVPLAALIYWLLPRAAPASHGQAAAGRPSATVARLFAPEWRRLTLTFGAAFFLYGGAIGGTSFYLPTFFQQTRGYDAASATQVVGLSYAVGMIGYVGAAFVSETWLSRAATVVLWLVLAALGLLATIWLPHTVREDTITFGVTTVFFYGTSSILFTSLLERFPAALRASAAALSGTACLSLGFVVFPVLTASAVAAWGWLASFTAIIVPAVFAAALLMWSLPRAGGSQQRADSES